MVENSNDLQMLGFEKENRKNERKKEKKESVFDLLESVQNVPKASHNFLRNNCFKVPKTVGLRTRWL